MAFPPRIAIATQNRHKLREILAICGDWPVEWVTVDDHDGPWPDVEEPHETYLRNAFEKAHAVAQTFGAPAIADDSGLEVDALGGAPGVRSARYAGEHATDADNRRMLVTALKGVPGPGRSARYRCVAAIAWPDGRELHADGLCEGTLRTKPKGEGGFGYDPLFEPEGWGRTMAELEGDEKDRISHRGRAFRALRARLAAEG